MIIAPAVVIGALACAAAVFAIVFAVTNVVLSSIAKRKSAPITKRSFWTEKNIDEASQSVGCIAAMLVGILFMLFISKNKELDKTIWMGLTILGFIVGVLSFFVHGLATGTQTKAKKYRPPAFRVRPPAQEDKYRPPASTGVPPPAQEDPYRKLLAKVRYDQSLADKLIEYERKHMPYASLDDLCRSAIARLERDN